MIDVLSSALLLLGGAASVVNYLICIAYYWRGRRSSLVPILGGGSLTAGLFLLTGFHWWCFLPLAADIGCIPLVGATIVSHLQKNASQGDDRAKRSGR